MTEPAYPDALPALTRLHWYVLERVLGQGAFGITYLAKDTNLDQRVAIKEYLPIDVATRMDDATVRSRTEESRDRYRWGLERFIEEARTLARFDHPNIVRVLSVFEFNNTAYMVMRFEEGGTLAALLNRRGTLTEPELLRILLAILNGLELVHNAGFIHRDIKPDNIHIGADGRPVLLDFGSARQALGSSHSLTILVAPGYAPFEQYYSDASSQGPWTDIYGLGATCYRAICGRPPLDAVSRSKGILGSTQEVMVPASVVGAGHYSGRLLAAIDHALAFAEKDRPQSIADWRRELVDGTEAADATAPSRAREAPKPRASTGASSAPTVTPDGPRQAPAGNATGKRARGMRAAAWALLVAVVGAAAAVAVYLGVLHGKSESDARIGQLEKQLVDWRAADAERERAARQQADRDAQQRQAQEQARMEEERAVSEASRNTEPAARPQTTTARNREERAATQAATPAKSAAPSVPKNVSRVQPAPSAKSPFGTEPAAMSVPTGQTPVPTSLPTATVATAPESSAAAAKPGRTPAEILADADNALTGQHYADALTLLRPIADAGNSQAALRLGDAYAEGHGVDRDLVAAQRWYEKAALNGETGAQLKLGAMFAKGLGVPQNNNLAYVWYGTAARLGSAPAKAERDRIVPLLQPAEKDQLDRLIASKVEAMAKKP